ncbi:recombinase family protein [Clostridium beijerinckii]|uniref:recombinase family protein n=1 Tax=Clostridium beijerinckii TaxID=1520 RepID=UPI00149418CE|nr:recombinase family protein [Clostridium beijerinckii]NOW07812.1 DNA invertase Pin-like site-specific DNA recombinase [Clostridium beijerinckii]NYC04414.1 DNA invertase Pin-like site-specific DNA recombinase [Clostridium beijerinckii]NYC05443.1 DNA invertase Pin-like site-specific DNA recombinase [Clostridium beijerinckii]
MKKSALYIRVSTTYQIDKDSLPLQREDLINYSKYVLGIDDYEIFEDAGFSGKNTDRPAFQNMMNRIKSHEFSHLIVWKIDRISRNLLDFCTMYDELKEYNCTFISKNEKFDTSSAMGESMLKIILVFAELERKLTSERVSAVMLSRAEKGLWNGASVPLGYKHTKGMKFPVIDDTEANVIKYIYELYIKNGSTPKVAYQLNQEKVKTKRGGTWTPKTVGDILRNPFYIGTYRYNVRNSGSKRRWKEKSEWVVVENNHSGIISPELFEKANEMLSDNYKGKRQYQRENTNTHIFSQVLVCGKCGSTLIAGLDSARKDGYRPSRYTCYSSRHDNINNCNNFISDITLLPFILNYIANFINLQNRITQRHSLRDIERILLRGKYFADVECIDRKGLEDTYIAFSIGFTDSSYSNGQGNAENNTNSELENLKKEKIKFEKALSRLEDLYLFDEQGISKKDYLFKKRDITQHIQKINEDISDINKKNSRVTTDISFLNKAGNFLIHNELTNKKNIDYRELLQAVDISLIKDFVNTVITQIEIIDKKVYSITFNNGITHKFLYKVKHLQVIRTREKFLYRAFEPQVIEYLKDNSYITRKDIENITGMSHTSANALLLELIDKGLIEKKGNSVATRYFLKA